MRKQGQSILNQLIRYMPSLKNKIIKNKNYVDSVAARTLFLVWKNAGDTNQNKVYRRPANLSLVDIKNMQKEGLIRPVGNNIEITDKGEKVIKIMVLGDDRSSFDRDDTIIDYNEALNRSKEVKTAKKHKVANNWWNRFKTENIL